MSQAQMRAAAIVERGSELLAQDRVGDALAMFEEAIAVSPHYAEAFALRGDVLTDLGRFEAAIASYDRAVALAPLRAAFHDHRAIALARLGRLELALGGFDRALTIDPENVNAMNNRANVLKLLNRPQQALDQLDRVVSALPGFAAAHSNRGNALLALERHDEAIASFDRAIALEPGLVDARSNRAMALVKSGRIDDAEAAYRGVLALAPAHVDALLSLGDIHAAKGNAEIVIDCFSRVLAIDPDRVEALYGRGLALANQRRTAEAIDDFSRAVAVENAHLGALQALADALGKEGRREEACACYDRLATLLPDRPEIFFKRGSLLREMGDLDGALENLDRALALDPTHPYALDVRLYAAMQLSRWDGFADQVEALSRRIRDGVKVTPFPVLAVLDDPGLQQVCARTYSRHFDQAPAPFPERTTRAGPIRIGYFSADFHAHATMQLLLEAIEAHDRESFEIMAFSYGTASDCDWRRRLVSAVDRFVDIRSVSEDVAVKLAREARIDVAIDLKGYTGGSRCAIFSRRAAPVQASFLGYPGTLGADWMDYLLADRTVLPEAEKAHYSEKIVYLPGSYQPNMRLAGPYPSTKRSDHGLPDTSFVFCCVNNNYKITPEMFSVWMRILSRVGNGILWLWVDSESARATLRREARDRGVDPARLVFAARAEIEAHLGRLGLADLFLDTVPCNAHTTASDALRAGLPLLTCPGRSFAARVAASLLTALELPELIAEDLAAYEARAIELAMHPRKLAAIRTRLARQIETAPLFDPVGAARKLEAAYTKMHVRFRSGLPPGHIEI